MTANYAWVCIMLAGCCEISFTTCMKLIDGQPVRNWPWVILLLVSGLSSFSFMSLAMTKLPIGTVYAVWTGIGAAGTAMVGTIVFGDPFSVLRGFFLLLLISSIIGLHWVN